jgi:single-stranded-DNA-specific exonuclease
MKFKWNIKADGSLPLLQQIYKSRQYPQTFFTNTIEALPPITAMKDLEKAAEKIIQAIIKKEKIIIFGHDDVDGITATYILFDFLEKLGSQNHYYYIPNRNLEAHGMQEGFFRKVKQKQIDLVITVDGGISDFEAVDRLQQQGKEVIITDHHIVQGKVPNAYAVVNPKQADCNYPFDMIPGVTISYFLAQKMAEKLATKVDNNYLFWVAAGSIADKVPMVGVNRTLVRHVLRNWHLFDDSTLLHLKDFLWEADSFRSKMGMINFINRLFANGRKPRGENISLRTLLVPDSEKHNLLLNLMNAMNKREKQSENLNRSLRKILKENEITNNFVYYDENDSIDNSYLGRVASVVAGEYKVPAILLKQKNGKLVCEARSTKGFDLMQLFKHIEPLLIQFGGHVHAAGFSANPEQKEQILAAIKNYIETHNKDIEKAQALDIDAIITYKNVEEFHNLLYDEIDILQPFGQQNPPPMFLFRNFDVTRDFFYSGKMQANFEPGKLYDVVFSLNGSNPKIIDYKEIL